MNEASAVSDREYAHALVSALGFSTANNYEDAVRIGCDLLESVPEEDIEYVREVELKAVKEFVVVGFAEDIETSVESWISHWNTFRVLAGWADFHELNIALMEALDFMVKLYPEESLVNRLVAAVDKENEDIACQNRPIQVVSIERLCL